MDLIYIIIIVLLLWSVFVLQLTHIATGNFQQYIEYIGAFTSFLLAVGIICWFAVGFGQSSEIATANICITLLWVIYIFQFMPNFIEARKSTATNLQRFLAFLPLIFATIGLVYWYFAEASNFNEFSVSNGVLHIIFAQYFFLFPTRFARTLYCIYKREPCKDNEDFFLRLFYYSMLWFIFSLLGDLTLFLVINIVNVLFQFSDIMVRVLLALYRVQDDDECDKRKHRDSKHSNNKLQQSSTLFNARGLFQGSAFSET